ncbi:MAG: imidazole glycerol phosphate synthase subunit HisF [Cryomorphaceae bacterium]|nr:imidazole glycerol phosphate synthase subunit HisF [Cryomorphaceae bacterium]
MNQRARIIPVLTIDQQKLVKTVKFKNPNYIGDPINAIKIFNDKMVDEIVVLDITASAQGREPNEKLIYEMAGECFSPLGYGGGITSFDQASKIFSLGVEKIILNSIVNTKPQLISEIANAFGSQSVVVSLDVKKKFLSGIRPHFTSGKSASTESIVEFAKRIESLGAGEIFVHDIERDGTFTGYNRELIKLVAGAVSVPVVSCGGASGHTEMFDIISETGASAAAAGSVFVYKGQNTNSILISYPTPADIVQH